MRDNAFIIINATLITTCIIMSLVFLFLPLPKSKGLRNYRISLRFLALAYLSLAALTLLDMLQVTHIINYPIALTAISFQTILFFFALTTLFNTNFVNEVYVIKHLIPTLLFVILLLVSNSIFENPPLQNLDDFMHNYTHPLAMLNMLFLLFCIAQLIYFIRLFLLQEKKYDSKLDNYYADTYQLRLSWVRYCFLGACAFGISVIASMFFTSSIFNLAITGINSLFYLVFGLFYIQYPLTYNVIEPILSEQQPVSYEEVKTINRTLAWEKLKSTIIADKYYLRSEINIEDMAQYLKIGRTTLSNYINKEEGMNFHAWINNLRIEEAKQLIVANPGYTIAQVAELVGYSEQSNFSRQFKQTTNQSPSVWKQEQLENPKN